MRGKVCNKPCENMACLRLKNIYENKKDEIEKAIAGCYISEHESEIPCIAEGLPLCQINRLQEW